MQRSRVLFPEPERPSNATISPSKSSSVMSSSTGSGLPSGDVNSLETCDTSMIARAASGRPLLACSWGCVIGRHSCACGGPGST